MSYQIIQGNCLDTLPTLPDASVQCCVTSPPYFGLRDYGVKGQLGLEPTVGEYVAAMTAVFREVARVLKPDGVLWLNLGDSYSSSNSAQVIQTKDKGGGLRATNNFYARPKTDLPSKNLIGIPWRVAFALQDDGWILRSDIIWHKPNPMPESVTDRPTRSHEYMFLFAKQERYYYNADAIKEPATYPGDDRKGRASHDHKTMPTTEVNGMRPRSHRDSFKREGSKREQVIPNQSVGTHRPDREESRYDTSMRNKRDVWTVAPATYADAHFATFPPDLIEPCILAGSAPGDTVLDPFSGSGTTASVALKHNRNAIGIELNPAYIEMSHKRIGQTQITLPMEVS